MKISELRACDRCKQPLGLTFYVLRISLAVVKPNAANQVLGLTQMLRGSLALAEAFAPEADNAVLVVADEDPDLMDEIFLCTDCYVTKDVRLPALIENKKIKRGVGNERQ